MVKVSKVKAWETTQEPRMEEIRASVVESVVAGLTAAQLSQAELLAVVAWIHASLAELLGQVQTGFALTATAISQGGQASSRTVQRACSMSQAMTATVALEKLARVGSPVLWEQLETVLSATDEELAELYRAAP